MNIVRLFISTAKWIFRNGFSLCFIGIFCSLVISACTTTSAKVSVSPLYVILKNKRIAVIDVSRPQKKELMWTILVAGQVNDPEPELMAQCLESELMEIGHYQIVERTHLKKIVQEQSFQMTGLTDTESAIKAGRLAGIDAIVALESSHEVVWIGLLAFGGAKSTAKLIDVETSNVIWTSQSTSNLWTILPVPPFWTLSNTLQHRMAKEIAAEIKKQIQ